VTLRTQLINAGQLDGVGGDAYIMRLQVALPSPSNARHYAQIVRDYSVLRALEAAGHEVVGVVRELDLPVEEKIRAAESAILAIGGTRLGADMIPMKSIARDIVLDIDEAGTGARPVQGLQSGFWDLDRLTTGFHPGNLIILGARPSMGKTSLALAFALAAGRNEPTKTVAIFSLEMTASEIGKRMVSMLARVPTDALRRSMSPEVKARVLDAAEHLYSAPMFVDESAEVSGFDILGKCRRLAKKNPLSLIVVDYLQLMRGSSKRPDNRAQEVGEIARALKGVAKELGVPVVALSQLSRSVESRENKRPQLSDLRESGGIEQEADLVMFVYRENYYLDRENPERAAATPAGDPELAEVIVAKHRNGPVGTAKLGFLPKHTLFMNKAGQEALA